LASGIADVCQKRSKKTNNLIEEQCNDPKMTASLLPP
jgi:hypothetical protein